jgi:pyrroloquinoline quinone (PQQ) biosynthesis protein C
MTDAPGDTLAIHEPIAIIHRTEDRQTQCVMYELSDQALGYKGHALAAADYIRHIAQAYGVEEKRVVKWVMRELNRPTSDVWSVSTDPNKRGLN